MLTSVRFGSESYFSGDMKKAEKCFSEALTLFQAVGNKRGIAISQNNLGSVYSQQKLFNEAHKAYVNSIELAQEDVNDATSPSQKRKATMILSSRMGNRAVCLMQEEKMVEAEHLIREAMSYDTQVGNAMGFVIKSGTMGSICLKQNRLDHAEATIAEAEKLLLDESTFTNADGITHEDYAIAQNYCKINRAQLSFTHGNYEQAWELCDEVLTNHNFTTLSVQTEALCLLNKIYKKIGALAATDDMNKLIGKASSGPKDVVFCYDYSGSMSGGRHNTAIECLQNIFHNHVKGTDRVCFIHFNKEVHLDVQLKEKAENQDEFVRKFRTLTSPYGGTAFYDSLDQGLNQFLNHKSPMRRSKWVIALTDGEDNSSKKNPNEIMVRLNGEDIEAFICVCVGVDQKVVKICEQMANSTPNGKVIDANGDVQSIKEAFAVVEEMLEGHMVLEKY